MNAEEYVYHWTHRNNLASILWTGLDPSYAEGKLKVVWFCDSDRVGWALAHIAARHGWNHDDMVLLRWPKYQTPFANTAFAGVYTTNKVVRLKGRSAVRCGILAEWVACVTVRKNTDKPVRTDPGTDTRDSEPSA